MPISRDDPLERPEQPSEQFPSRGVRPEKILEGSLLTLSDITPGKIGAAPTNHGHLLHNLSAVDDPGVTDDEILGYTTASIWINISTPAIFVCVTAAEGAADWNQTDAVAAASDHDHTGGGDGGILTKPELDDYMILGEITDPGATPASGKGWLYVKATNGTNGLYFEADDGTVTDLLAAGHAEAHGKAQHTENGNWKLRYTDASGDEQEIALGAADTVLRSVGASSVPTMTAMKVLHAIPFVAAAEDATVEIMLPLPGVCIGESGEMGTVTGVRFKVYMGTAGVTGTMTVKLYADSASNFPSETEIATVDITTEIEDDDTTITSWTPGTDNFLRAKITALHSGTVAKDVACIFYYETTLHA